MKADMEVMKEQMTIMMEAMMSMRKMMEVNTATIVAESTAIEMNPTHPFGLNQVNRPVSDTVGQGGEALGSIGGPHFVQVQSKHSFPPYGLPPYYTPPNVAHAPDENVDNSTPILIESVHHIGWCIVGRQALWREGVLVWILHIMEAVPTSQIFAYHS